MAVTADKVVVELQAKTDAYNARIAAAQQQFENRMRSLSDAAVRAGKATEIPWASAERAAAAAAKGMTAALPAVSAAGNEMRMAQQHARNLAFQFQDIGTMLAAGQSPFMLLAQQLPQVTMYGGQLNGVMGALKSTVAGLFSPLGLATTAFVLLGSASISYFSTLFRDSERSEKELREHERRVGEIAKRWSDAVPALKAYIEAREAAKQVNAEAAAQEELTKNLIEEMRPALDDLSSEYQSLSDVMMAWIASGRDVDGTLSDMMRSWQDMLKALSNGTLTTDQVDKALETLNATVEMGVPRVQRLKDMFSLLTAELYKAAAAAEAVPGITAAVVEPQLTGKFIAEQERLNSLTSDQLRLEREIERVKADAEKDGAILTEQQALEIARQRLSAEERRANIKRSESEGAAAAKRAAEELAREKKAVDDLILSLEHELNLLGMTKEEREVANALRQAGAAATKEQRDRIEELITSQQAQEAFQKRVNDSVKAMDDIAKSAGQSLANAFSDGKVTAEELIPILTNVILKLIEASKAAGGFGNLLANILGGGFNPTAGGFADMLGISGRASGGPVRKGQPYIVGERRPELFVPDQSGTILPQVPRMPDMAAASRSAAASISFAPVYQIDARGADAAAVARLERGLAKTNAEMKATVIETVREANSRNVKFQ